MPKIQRQGYSQHLNEALSHSFPQETLVSVLEVLMLPRLQGYYFQASKLDIFSTPTLPGYPDIRKNRGVKTSHTLLTDSNILKQF